MTTPSIPAGVAAIDAEWLTGALKETISPGASVVDCQSTRIAEGVGFLGELARVKLTYSGDPGPSAPRSVVVKMPVQLPGPRAMAVGLGIYAREVAFYREIGPSAGVRVPACYYSALTEDGNFALVMEDINARPGDQLASCSMEQAETVIRTLARLHATWWESPRLAGFAWLPGKGDPSFERNRLSYQQTLPVFVERWGPRLDPKVIHICQRFADRFHEWFDGVYERPVTLTHSDFRLDNVLFGEPGSAEEVVIIDWQGCNVSSAAHDLHYFISGNFPAAVSAAKSDEWLRVYHDALLAGGVRGYSLDDLNADFARASTFFVMALVFGGAAIDPDDQTERGRLVGDQLFGSLADSMVRYDALRFLE